MSDYRYLRLLREIRHASTRLVVLAFSLSILWRGGGSTVAAQQPTAAPTPTPIPTLAPIHAMSMVTSGTAGTTLPPGLSLTLHALHNGSDGLNGEYVTQTLPLPASDTVQFAPFQAQLGDVLVVTTQYAGITQGSIPVILSDSTDNAISLPVTLYQQTSDPSALQISRDEQVLSFPSPDQLSILETVEWTNHNDRFYLSKDKTPSGTPVSVTFQLPPGAEAVAFSSKPIDRFVVTGDAGAPLIEDTVPVIPNIPQQMVFSYQLAYSGGAYIDRNYPVAVAPNSVQVLIPDDTGVQFAGVKTADFVNAPNTTLNPQRSYTMHTLSSPLAANGRLIYTVTGKPVTFTSVTTAQSTAAPPPPAPINVGLIIALVGVMVVVLGVLWGLRRRILRGADAGLRQ